MSRKRKAAVLLKRQSEEEASEQMTPESDINSRTPIKGAGVLPKPSESNSPELKEEKDIAAVNVDSAIKGLARMERRLRRDLKRQKLKLEESAILHGENKVSRVSAPRPSAASSPDAAIGHPPLPTPEEKAAEDYAHGGGGDGEEEAVGRSAPHPDAVDRGAARPSAVNSDYLPLPWKGRLGYVGPPPPWPPWAALDVVAIPAEPARRLSPAHTSSWQACLNTYLRTAKPTVFSSRTCRMSSIIDHRHPLADSSKPEHTTKNRPDKTKQANVALGLKYVQGLGLANARDIVKMLRWNERYGIRFMRLSSDMFPFASHQEHGYKLAPFASDVLAEAGKVAAELGHRLTTHPGQVRLMFLLFFVPFSLPEFPLSRYNEPSAALTNTLPSSPSWARHAKRWWRRPSGT